MRTTTTSAQDALVSMLILWMAGIMASEAGAQVIQPAGPGLSLPIRWCALEGTPTVINPEFVGEVDSDGVLWRRHERISDAVFIPQARVTLRSALWNIGAGFPTRFPIIADPDPPLPAPDNTRGDLGDLGDPSEQIPHPELVVYNIGPWNKAYASCVAAWRARGVSDIGVVAIVAKQLRRTDGSLSPFVGFGRRGDRSILLTDNAFALAGSPLASGVSDHVDKLLGHEIGHTLPTHLSAATTTRGLRHTCSSNRNLMLQGRTDLPPADGLIDNFLLSPSIGQVLDSGPDGFACNSDDPPGTETVDQIRLVTDAVRNSPGCKLVGSNTNCSDAMGDACPDESGDLPVRFADITRVQIAERAGFTTIVHDLFGRADEIRAAVTHAVEFVVMVDTDHDAATGAAVADLGLPSTFVGAELVARVELLPFVPPASTHDGSKASVATIRSTVWQAQGGTFSEVVDPAITARVRPTIFAAEGETIHAADSVEIELPTSLFAPRGEVVRVQGMSLAHQVDGTAAIDRLDDRTDETGFDFRFASPSFPLCRVTPEPVTAGRSATVEASGLLPGAAVKVFLAEVKVGTGVSNAGGEAAVGFTVPADATAGERLVTVGVEGTALTADCFAVVEPFPDCNHNGRDDADDIASGRSEDLNANGDPDECEIRQVSWIFEGTATGGQIDIVIDGWDATCMVSVPTMAGETGEMVAANVAAVLAGEACLVDQGITATTDGNRLILEGLDLGARDVDYTTTDAGLRHRTPITDIPTLSTGALALFVLALALVMWRRSAAPGA